MRIALKEKHQISGDDLDSVIRLARGSIIEATEIIEISEENELNFIRFGDIMRFCWSRNFVGVNTWVEEMTGLGRERLKNFFTYALQLVRENFILNLNTRDINYMTKKEADFSARFHPYINGNNVIKISEELTSAISDIERNGYAKLILFDMSLRLMKLIRPN